MWIIQIRYLIPSIKSYRIYNCLMVVRSHTNGKIEKTWWRGENLKLNQNNKFSVKALLVVSVENYSMQLQKQDSVIPSQWRIRNFFKLKTKNFFHTCVKITFSGKCGVTNGIWKVLLYECSVSNESLDTAPNMANTPRENWLQTEIKKKKKSYM